MIDIEWVKKNKSKAEERLKARGLETKKISEVLEADEAWRKLMQEVEELRAERNRAAKDKNIEAGKKIKASLDDKEDKLVQAEKDLDSRAKDLPNLPLADVPVGDESKKKVLEESGKPPEFSFQPKDHLQLGEWLDVIDTTTAAKVSGTRFAYLKNEGALLELALVNFAFERLVQLGFVPIIPPTLIRKSLTENLGYWQAGGNENYYLVSDLDDTDNENPLYLIGTAEHAIVPMHTDQTLPHTELPKRYVAYSPAYRREAGAYGKDTRGIIRVHQFEKIEMVSFVMPDQSEDEFKTLADLPWKWMQELGLPVRRVVLSSEDMSFPAAKTIDIETWFPSQKEYRETHSISTTTDFQARRFNTRYSADDKTGYVHILNGTAFAVGRTIAAILENYQKEDGSVTIPEVLRPFTGFEEIKVG